MEGAKLYWDAKNAAGGICGRKVELKVQDTGYDPQKAVAAYQQLGDVIGLGLVLGSSIVNALLPNVRPTACSSTSQAGRRTPADRERRDRRHDLRHRGDQRRRLPDEGEGGQEGRHDRPPVLRGRLRRERAGRLQAHRERGRADRRRAEDHADRPGHDRPGHRPQTGRRQGDRDQRGPAAGRFAGGGGGGERLRRTDRRQRLGLAPQLLATRPPGALATNYYVVSPSLPSAWTRRGRRSSWPTTGRPTRRHARPTTARCTPTGAQPSPSRTDQGVREQGPHPEGRPDALHR